MIKVKDILTEQDYMDGKDVVGVLVDGTTKETDISEWYSTERDLNRIIESYGEDEVDNYEIEEREEWFEYYGQRDYYLDHPRMEREVTVVIKLMTA